ncbi:MAG TPA: hypothetical protein VFW85_03020 [Gaiellaceae bacterium]|nr:hypothetical protein [Gaiellaceae bacterium]
MKRLLTNIATISVLAGSAFAGHALAANRTITAAPDPSGFGSSVREQVIVGAPEYVLDSSGATLKRVRCSVAQARTVCYAATR